MSLDPPKVLVIPHSAPGGGAGRYIRDFMAYLGDQCALSACGEHARRYGHPCSLPTPFADLNVPIYRGASHQATFYWLARSGACFHAAVDRLRRLHGVIDRFDVVVLTSSIQIPAAEALRRAGYHGRVVCLIQENVNPRDPYGGLIPWRAVDLYICVAKSTTSRFEAAGLRTFYLPNRFGPDTPDALAEPQFDAVYLGGGSKLKGFDFLLRTLERAQGRRLSISMLGQYSPKRLTQIARLNARPDRGAHLTVVGQVENAQTHIANARIVLLPIGQYHFCRAAVEAGFQQRTYVVPRFRELTDFGEPGQTSFVYEPGSRSSFMTEVRHAVSDAAERARRSRLNRQFVSESFDDDHWKERVSHVFRQMVQ